MFDPRPRPVSWAEARESIGAGREVRRWLFLLGQGSVSLLLVFKGIAHLSSIVCVLVTISPYNNASPIPHSPAGKVPGQPRSLRSFASWL